MIAGFDDQRQLSIPLIVLPVRMPCQYQTFTDHTTPHQVVKESDYSKLVWPEAPKVLLLAAPAYSHNPALGYHDRFVVCLEGPCFYVSRLRTPRGYMASLFEEQGIAEDLPLYRSQKFDVFDCNGRREIVRMLIGVLRYLDGREQWKILGDYQYVPLASDSS